MGVRKTVWRLLPGAFLLLSCTASAGSRPSEGSPLQVQVFAALDQSIVALGEPFTFTVEVYASPTGPAEAEAVAQAFERAELRVNEAEILIVRSERSPVQQTVVEGSAVIRYREQFILRARRTGRIAPPEYRLQLDTRTFTPAVPPLSVYRVDPAFFRRSPAILQVIAEAPVGSRVPDRMGTAFLVAPDAAVTSFHVIMDAERVQLKLPDGKSIRTKKVWVLDPARDIAVLYVDPEEVERAGLPVLQLAPVDDRVRPSWDHEKSIDVVFTNGWAFGRQRSTAGHHFSSITLDRYEPFWVSSNPLRPGDSGGPLLDWKGRVLGVVASGTVRQSKDHVREDMCVATDPRPALGLKLLTDKPLSLKSYLRDPRIAREPQTSMLRVSAELGLGYSSPAFLDRAITLMDASAARAPRDARIHLIRGALMEMRGVSSDAVRSYEAALEAHQDYFPATYMLALHHIKQQQYEKARALFIRTGNYAPYTRLALYGEAVTLLKQYQYERALPLLQDFLRLEPNFAPALFDLARCLFALGESEKAYQIIVKMEDLSAEWANKLRISLSHSVFHPFIPFEMPLAQLPP